MVGRVLLSRNRGRCVVNERASLCAAPDYVRAPQVPESIADDLIFAMKRGWITLPPATESKHPEASERLTRLHALLKWARSDRG